MKSHFNVLMYCITVPLFETERNM